MTVGVGATDSRAIWRLETSSGSYHGFGVWQRDGNLVAHHFVNGVEVQRQVLMTGVTPNTWYVLELAVDDGAGMRATVWKESEAGTRNEARFEMPRGIAWRFHAWSGNGVMSLDEYAEQTPGGGSADSRIVGQHYEYDSVSAQTTKRYYAGGRLVATRTGSAVRYVHADHLGSTTTLTDPNGNVVAREKYSAFGERRRGESPLITDQLYTGQRYNVLSSLYHYSDGKSAGRFYDPLLGRFVSADSVTPGSSSQTLNRFSYGLNNPVRYIDPNGQACIDANAGGGIGVGAAYAVGMSIGNEISRQAAQWGQRITQWGPQVTATVDKAAGIAKSAQQNTENAQRASHSNSGETGDPQPPRDPNDLKSKLRDASPDVLRQAVQEDLKKFSEAHEYGVKSYNALSRDTAHTGLQAHHLIEKRFANILGVQQGDIPSIALKAGEHQKFTNRWLEQIGRINMHTPLRTDSATRSDIWNAAQVVYQEYPGLLETIRQYLQVP